MSEDKRHPKQQTYVDPYGHIVAETDPTKQRTTGRVVADICINDFRMLKSIRPHPGTIQTTVNILLHKLINELKSRGILDYTRCDDFERFVTELRLVAGGETAGSPHGETPRPHDGGRTPRTGALLPTATQQPSVPTGGDQPRGKRGRGQRKSEGAKDV